MSEMNYEKRIEEKLKRIEIIEAKKMQLQNELKDLKHRKKTADEKQRTHLLCCAGGELANIFGHVLEKDEIRVLGNFIRGKMKSGEFSLEIDKLMERRVSENESQEELKQDFPFMNDLFDL